MSIDMFDDVKKFHKKYKIPLAARPSHLKKDVFNYRLAFIDEELTELIQAYQSKDKAGQLDALVDLVYVALGTAAISGFPFKEAWKRVHQANMKKVRVKKICDSKRGHRYDVVKPEDWIAPDLTDLVKIKRKRKIK